MGLYGCVAGGDVFVQQHGLAYRGLIHAGSGCPNPPELRYPLGRVSSLFVADSVWSVQENVDSVVAFIEDFG
jgi:hypothetical protein